MNSTQPWYNPAPGTAAHSIRSAVRYALWGGLGVAAALLADPSTRAALLGA